MDVGRVGERSESSRVWSELEAYSFARSVCSRELYVARFSIVREVEALECAARIIFMQGPHPALFCRP